MGLTKKISFSWILLAITLLLGWNALHNPFVLDDGSKIVQNTEIRSLTHLPQKLITPYEDHQVLERNDPSRPLVFTLWALLYHFFGLNPLPYRLLNLALHWGSACLVFALAQRIAQSISARTSRRAASSSTIASPSVETWIPFAASLAFLVAPIHFGTAIYIYSLSDILVAFWSLLALYWFSTPAPQSRPNFRIFVAICLALATKQTGVLVPALCSLYAYFFFAKPNQTFIRRLRETAHMTWPLFLPALVYLVGRRLYFGPGGLGDLEGRGNTLPAGVYAMMQPWVILRYLALTFFPRGLAIDHAIARLPELTLIWAGTLFAFVCAGFAYLGKKSPWIAFGAIFYAICVAPTSSFLPTVDFLVERRVYLANAGLLIAVSAAIGMFYQQILQRNWLSLPALRRGTIYTLAFYFLINVAVVLQRNQKFQTERGVWEDTLSVYPQSVRAINNLGNALLEEQNFTEAEILFSTLISRDPQDSIALANLASIYSDQKNPKADLRRSNEYLHTSVQANPNNAVGYYNLGRNHQLMNDFVQAEKFYQEAIRVNPRYVLAHNNLGLIYLNRGEKDEARKALGIALQLEPSCEPCRTNWSLLEGEGRREISVAEVPTEVVLKAYEAGLAKDPSNPTLQKNYRDFCQSRGLACRSPSAQPSKRK